jgi:hypothetical protein
MYGQLTAIAREFGFPSTTGLCLYLHVADAGFAGAAVATPRISDETWTLLWAHLFDARAAAPASPLQLPIGGRIEFDVDPRKARWFEPWLAAARRDAAADVPASVAPSLYAPSQAPSHAHAHWRQDSRGSLYHGNGSYAEESSPEDAADGASSVAARRHVPRKLSLLDRFDTASQHSSRAAHSRRPSPPHAPAEPAPGPPRQPTPPSHPLTPIPQADEPAAPPRETLETRVNSWRASATLVVKTPLAARGQVSLDPAHLPNAFSLSDPVIARSTGGSGAGEEGAAEGEEAELNLDDFTWSVTSAGPPSEASPAPSPADWAYVFSPHLDRRLAGSVCMTPSAASSAGPPDYAYDALDFDLDFGFGRAGREWLPTPDVATRMLEDCPPTPSTATSWGPPDDEYDCGSDGGAWFELPPWGRRPASVHLADRGVFSRPATPSTATSWGPPDDDGYAHDWPARPSSRASSVDIAARAMFAPDDAPARALVFPYYDAWTAAPWAHVWPYVSEREREKESGEGGGAWRQVWPYRPAAGAPWAQVWPYRSSAAAGQPWKQVWPYRSGEAGGEPWKQVWSYQSAPARQPWKQVWPYREAAYEGAKSLSVRIAARYPAIELYPAAYPALEVYPPVPAVERAESSRKAGVPVRIARQYPIFDICECRSLARPSRRAPVSLCRRSRLVPQIRPRIRTTSARRTARRRTTRRTTRPGRPRCAPRTPRSSSTPRATPRCACTPPRPDGSPRTTSRPRRGARRLATTRISSSIPPPGRSTTRSTTRVCLCR